MNHKQLRKILALFILAVCALSVQAQSGRRQTKPPPAAPVPTPTPEPTPTPKKDETTPEVVLLVGTDRNEAPASIPLHFHSAALRGCADRLKARSSAEVDTAQRDMNRSEAIEKAKASPNTYVILLTLRLDVMATTYDDMQLDFIVFAPETAKIVITGRSYINTNRVGPVVAGPTSRLPSGVYREQWLRQAGEDAADRILKKLNLGVRVPK
jgi:hypothetical protein